MTEPEQKALSEMLNTSLMQKAFTEVARVRRKSDIDSVEKAALAQAFNTGLLAGLNGLLELAKLKPNTTITTRKLRHD